MGSSQASLSSLAELESGSASGEPCTYEVLPTTEIMDGTGNTSVFIQRYGDTSLLGAFSCLKMNYVAFQFFTFDV